MKRSDAETLQEYYQRINDIIDDRNRLQYENALMREQLGAGKRKPLKWSWGAPPDHMNVFVKDTDDEYRIYYDAPEDIYCYIPLQDILDLIEENE